MAPCKSTEKLPRGSKLLNFFVVRFDYGHGLFSVVRVNYTRSIFSCNEVNEIKTKYNTPEKGVAAPLALFNADLAKLPVIGNPLKNDTNILLVPRAMSSCEASTL